MSIKIALPKGLLLKETAALTSRAGWDLSDYSESARLYHLTSARFSDSTAKIFHEKDIPVQVAMGNYDLGICGLDWIQELMVKYPASALVKVIDLGYGRLNLVLAASSLSDFSSLESIRCSERTIGIASEYPNLAESLALNCRFKRFNVYPVWGAAEIYPPENADLVLLADKTGRELAEGNLIEITRILDSRACLIANKTSWETKDLSEILNTVYANLKLETHAIRAMVEPQSRINKKNLVSAPEDSVRIALPDGHAQKHVVNILNKTNIKLDGYPSDTGNRRPDINLPGCSVKVIRPQDMPLQVANGKFDLAITGKDWVREHLYRFPSSPITELLDLKYSRVKIVVAVNGELPINDIHEFRKIAFEEGRQIRLASEYVSIADKYARDNRLGTYRVIPTWGATEAFVPDDADLLIENTETGSTLKRHNLKIIETLFESSACLIAYTGALNSPKASKIKSITTTLHRAVEDL